MLVPTCYMHVYVQRTNHSYITTTSITTFQLSETFSFSVSSQTLDSRLLDSRLSTARLSTLDSGIFSPYDLQTSGFRLQASGFSFRLQASGFRCRLAMYKERVNTLHASILCMMYLCTYMRHEVELLVLLIAFIVLHLLPLFPCRT